MEEKKSKTLIEVKGLLEPLTFPPYIPTINIDSKTYIPDGWWILSGAPGTGKTRLAIQIMHFLGKYFNYETHHFNFEMDAHLLKDYYANIGKAIPLDKPKYVSTMDTPIEAQSFQLFLDKLLKINSHKVILLDSISSSMTNYKEEKELANIIKKFLKDHNHAPVIFITIAHKTKQSNALAGSVSSLRLCDHHIDLVKKKDGLKLFIPKTRFNVKELEFFIEHNKNSIDIINLPEFVIKSPLYKLYSALKKK